MSNTKSKIHWLLTAMLLVAAMLMPMGASAVSLIKPSGDGSSSNPYQISSATDLYWFAGLVNGTLPGVPPNKAACAILTTNIIVNSGVLTSQGYLNTSNMSKFVAWEPIGNDPGYYTGTFDGNGKVISGLYLNSPSKSYAGLFGYSSGTITNVGIEDSYFYGYGYVGGICGLNAGTVKKCYNKCPIQSVYNGIGGVCGVNSLGATITNCYNTGSITADQYHIGGVCGYNYGTLSNCYSTGALLETKGDAGGVCGTNSGSITNCYYDKEKCTIRGINGEDEFKQAEGRTTAQFASGEIAYILQGSQSETVWGQTLGTEGTEASPVIGGKKVNYGFFANDCTIHYTNSSVMALPPHTLDSNGFCTRCGGYQIAEKVSSTHHPELNSTHNGYYAIENAGQYYWLAALVNGELKYMPQNEAANAVLTANITVNEGVLTSDGSLSTNSGNFRSLKSIAYGKVIIDLLMGMPVTRDIKYDGTFDGNGKTISGLYLSNSEWNIAIFGTLSSKGTIKNVGFIDSYINATRFVSGICSKNYGCIENCYIKGVINAANDEVAGICDENYKTIKNCYVAGKVNGMMSPAAIVAFNSGNVTNCYYLDTTTSSAFVGNSGTATKVESKTLAQFKSGEVAYLLQGDMTKQVWGQTIGTDDYPVIGGPKVNYGYTCTDTELGYKNEICFETPGHKYDNGFCPRCHGYQPAEKVSATHHPELNATHSGYYAIENGGQLYWLAGVVNGTIEGTSQNVAANAVLANNITVNNNVLKSDGSLSDDASTFRVWNPIGYYADESQSSSEPAFYVGTFDGNCKTVSGLYYNRRVADAEFIGLFGAVGEQGFITNVGVVDSYFNAYAVTGGICGYLAGGTIRNCYNSATVKGTPESSEHTDITIGGVCGGLYQGTISNCYNNGAVSGTKNVGAVCGAIEGASFTFANCYYDNEKCSVGGINNSDALGRTFGKSTAQFSSGEVAYLLSKGYNGSVWGQQLGTDAYPLLGGAKVYYGYALNDCQHRSYSNTTRTETPNHTYDNGFCTICDGYQPAIKVDGNYAIENAGQLYWYASQANNYPKTEYTDGAVLVADITVNEGVLNSDGSLSSNSSNFRPWTPIGYRTETDRRELYGMVDGNGHIISGLYCNDANKDYTGLVGYGNCTIKNLGLVDTYFKGKDYVGSICAYNVSGNIQDCYSVSNVAGTSNVGSICGYNYNGTITNCYYDNEKCSTGGVNGADVSGQTVGKATDKFHNGEVAYLLAYVDVDEYETWNTEIWGQQLGTDPYPVGSAYKLIPTALKKEDNTYWATFSDQGVDATLSVPSGRTLNVYNATVSGGTLTLSKRNDCQVAVEEGVLLKTDGEYVNIKANEDYTLTPVDYAYNNLVATRSYAETIIADEGYTLYRLTYNNSTEKTGLGFYLGLVKDENGKVDATSLGKKLKATPGKAYLNVATEAATNPATTALARSFVFPGDDETTGIGEIVIEGDAGISGTANADGRIYNLQGQQVTAPVKGLYIKNNKKVIIK